MKKQATPEAPSAIPSGRRKVSLGKDVLEPTATKDMQVLAMSCFIQNRVKNDAARDEAKNRQTLYKTMKEGKVRAFTVRGQIEEKPVVLDVEISTPSSMVVNIDLLRKEVSEEVFLKIVTATQAAVKEHAGEAILRRCSEERIGTENVTVKAAK